MHGPSHGMSRCNPCQWRPCAHAAIYHTPFSAVGSHNLYIVQMMHLVRRDLALF